MKLIHRSHMSRKLFEQKYISIVLQLFSIDDPMIRR